MNKNMVAIALASLLVGGVATAAYINNRGPSQTGADSFDAASAAHPANEPQIYDGMIDDGTIPAGGKIEYADVISAEPIFEKEALYATVIGTEPVRETITGSAPREVCEDVAVQERLPERDGNVGGTVAGALIGGLVGNQVGDGNGRKAATVAGAAAGGYIGNRVDRKHQGGQVVTRTERQCRTVSDTTTSSRTVAWNVTYRTPDGHTDTMRTDRKPGSRISMGTEKRVVGYDVTYRYRGERQTLRMDDKPGDRLPVIDGRVVTGVAVAGTPDRG
ncbi:glycine zipper 2TM domain-containing protein [Lysobacter hankyongensis]|uniref:Glycine zipper 2TM domain-containing protein n=1 Tax=Lysobacter hankyongensis TaxID=1176535 RepID=A0ABP9CAZ2_9GAMM